MKSERKSTDCWLNLKFTTTYLIFLLTVFSAGYARAHHNVGYIQLCNEGLVATNVAMVSRNSVAGLGTKLFDLLSTNEDVVSASKGWVSRGWHVIGRGECKTMIKSADAYEIYFSFANKGSGFRSNVSIGGYGLANTSDSSFCVNTQSAYKRLGTLKAHQTCQGSDQLAPFPVYVVVAANPNNYDMLRKIVFQ